ncbi:MAG TPA: Ig-like domain-containing protein [Polyangiaceae bacterium]|nr:Ig-like domain-containing protein [Polyangiaceae bacterium]
MVRKILGPPALLLAALAVTACQKGPPPRAVAVELPEQVFGGEAARALVGITDANGNRTTSSADHDFVVEPPDLATVTKKGFVTCEKSGDGKISVTVQDVTGSAPLACRVVTDIEIPDVGRVDIGDGPFQPKARVRDKTGKELSDVKLTYSPQITSAVKAKGLELVPVGVGQTEVVASAGPAKTTFKVEVVRRLKPEALPMDNNKRIDFSLPPGNYELVVNLETPKPIRVTWRTAPYCHYDHRTPKKQHVATCTLQEKGGVVFDNPVFLNHGELEVGHRYVEIREIP